MEKTNNKLKLNDKQSFIFLHNMSKEEMSSIILNYIEVSEKYTNLFEDIKSKFTKFHFMTTVDYLTIFDALNTENLSELYNVNDLQDLIKFIRINRIKN